VSFIYGYQRVADPGACPFCLAVNGAYVKSADASPLHPHCGCSLSPLTSPHPGAAWLPDGTHVTDKYSITEHGELGAMLGPGDASAPEVPVEPELTPLQKLAAAVDPQTATVSELTEVGQAIMDKVEPQMAATQADIEELRAAVATHEAEAELLYSRLDALGDRETFSRTQDAWGKAASATIKTRKQLRAAEAALPGARAEALRAALEEIRPMGGEITAPSTSTSRGKEVIARVNEYGSPYLPERWIERANANGPVTGFGMPAGGRAFYKQLSAGDGVIHLDLHPGLLNKDSTVLHEISHRMEYTVPELMRLEDQFLRERAVGELRPLAEITGNHDYEEHEVAYGGDFTHPYMGKVYDRVRPWALESVPDRLMISGTPQSGAGELFTMGQEGVWYGEYDLWEKDPEMVSWVLGLLATL
jgi:hypothetical protein